MRTNRLSCWGLTALAIAMMTAASSSGCRVDQDDIQRWEKTERGPDKLVAVIAHDKYDPTLRVEAALALVRMKPRGGRRIGIPIMVDAIAQLTDSEIRKTIIAGMVPALVSEIGKPVPVAQANQPAPPDTSIPFKDAAFALLIRENSPGGKIVSEEQHRQALMQALASWVTVDFEHRYDNASQMYGVEQIIKYIGAPAARMLPSLIHNDQRKISDLARIIAANGDKPTKEEASKRVVAVAAHTISAKWLDSVKSTVEEANKANKLKPTEAQFAAQLTALQDEQLKRLFGSMRQLGGRAAVDFCFDFALNKENSAERRALAMAALEGNFDQQNPNDVSRILSLAAADDTPDQVRDLAFRRVGEMRREKVIEKLYEIFKSERWQARWVAAQYAIGMSNTSNIPEILNHLPRGGSPVFAMTEALSYGDWMGNPERMRVQGKDARAQLEPYFRDSNSAVRTSALGWFFGHGTKHDIAALEPFFQDKGSVPKCGSNQSDCDWTCYVDKEGGKPDEKEPKEATNIGEFIRFCIVPTIKDRNEDPSKKKDANQPATVTEKK
ncbi:MAG TPA: hypothetical protein PLJ27_15690 [Polyangiaceae bacterium]|jgi:hypothetical protein|nr:MAG: hypothetical protein BWY17_04464 [Deltaproteobacteria bacterium ADurb.Bin207]HNS97761.1 hypothetical protein [Polyangiaceae bacterium]HNZ25212.1 hypothetical protein [Polyangiaceae bacterium]HOD25093.1 hypothetical protein [Polyangiaceae bacterium]HOE51771.1 hypothetical protein [Polyangiaceae bacterium]